MISTCCRRQGGGRAVGLEGRDDDKPLASSRVQQLLVPEDHATALSCLLPFTLPFNACTPTVEQ